MNIVLEARRGSLLFLLTDVYTFNIVNTLLAFNMNNLWKYSVIGFVGVAALSFFLTYLKVETISRYPGNCNRVPGS